MPSPSVCAAAPMAATGPEDRAGAGPGGTAACPVGRQACVSTTTQGSNGPGVQHALVRSLTEMTCILLSFWAHWNHNKQKGTRPKVQTQTEKELDAIIISFHCVRCNALPGQRLAATSFAHCFTGRLCRLRAGRHRWTGNILLTALFMDTAGLRSRVPQTHVNSLTRVRPEQCFVCRVSVH